MVTEAENGGTYLKTEEGATSQGIQKAPKQQRPMGYFKPADSLDGDTPANISQDLDFSPVKWILNFLTRRTVREKFILFQALHFWKCVAATIGN